jgi:DNA-binding transcriptional LysR family regulator
MNISGFDLNLLLVFDAVLAERSISRAADRLDLSQPAVSNALARMRKATGDRLFVRLGNAMSRWAPARNSIRRTRSATSRST